MLSTNDFKEKQIIFIESFDTKNISFDNENLMIKENGIIKSKTSLYKIFAIFLIGETTITSVLIRKFQEFGITLVLMKKNLLPYLVIGTETEGNTILRRKQYEKTDEELLEIAKNIIKLKTRNQLTLLKAIREKDLDLKGDIEQIEGIISKIESVETYESLLGYEGNVSKIFFSEYFKKIGWHRRTPRAKSDIKNLLMDIGYTYLLLYRGTFETLWFG